MHCLLTGASGYLGRALLPALVARGCSVTAQVFRGAVPQRMPPEVTVVRGDLRQLAGNISLGGVEQVFHLAGVAHQRADAGAYEALNVEAACRLAARARDAGVRRFVFVSSVKAASGGIADEPAAHGSTRPPAAPLDYGSSKRRAEEALLALCAAASMQLVILRPALVYDRDAPGHLAWLQRWVDLRLPTPPRGGARSMVSRADFVALCCALLDAAPVPQRLVLTDGEAYTTRRLHAALCRARDRRPRLPSPPAALWRRAGNAFDRLRGQPGGSTWQRLVGSELYVQAGLAEMGFRPVLTLERVLGLPP